MLTEQFVEQISKDVSSWNDTYSEKCETVNTQAIRHVTRSNFSELYEISRPNEDAVYRKWRNENIRNITFAPIRRFVQMLDRVIKESFPVKTNDEDFPGYDNLRYNKLLPLSISDPNAVFVEFPYNPKNHDIPPATHITEHEDGMTDGEPIETKGKIIRSRDIVFSNEKILMWFGGQIMVKKSANNGRSLEDVWEDFYYIVDVESFHRYLPYYDENNELKYRLELWYFHNINRLPVAFLPGVETEIPGTNLSYKESICMPAFEFLDECVIALSTDQVNRIRFLSPKLIVDADITCRSCNGLGTINGTSCSSCSGTGSLHELGEFSSVKVDQPHDDTKPHNRVPLRYLQPPGGLEYSKQVWENMLEHAERALCNDPLDGTPNESGIAKQYRLEPKHDLLSEYGRQFARMSEDIYNNRIKMRFVDFEEDDLITIHVPMTYETKTTEVLKMEVESVFVAERRRKYLKYISSEYRGNDLMVDVHRISTLYAPFILYKDDEIMTAINSGAYSEDGIIKRDYATEVFKIFLSDPQTAKLPLSDLFKKADELLIEWGVLVKNEAPIETI